MDFSICDNMVGFPKYIHICVNLTYSFLPNLCYYAATGGLKGIHRSEFCNGTSCAIKTRKICFMIYDYHVCFLSPTTFHIASYYLNRVLKLLFIYKHIHNTLMYRITGVRMDLEHDTIPGKINRCKKFTQLSRIVLAIDTKTK